MPPSACGCGAGTAWSLTLRSLQAYELQRLDMPAEQAVLAAAAPPGLLDAARATWAQAALRASFPSLAHLQNLERPWSFERCCWGVFAQFGMVAQL